MFSITANDTDNDGMADERYILYFEPEASKTAFQISTEVAYELRNGRGGRESSTTNTFPYSQQRLTVAKIWGSKTNTHNSLSKGATAKIIPFIQIGGSRKQDGSTSYSGLAVDEDGQPPFVIGGNMLAGDVANHWVPTKDDEFLLGTEAGGSGSTDFRWKQLVAGTTTISTSDAREKINIKDNNLGLDFINDLRSVSFEWAKPDKTGLVHRGIIAQEVIEVLKKHGIDDLQQYAGISKGGQIYGARYEEFVAPLIKAIQELSDKVKKLEDEAKE